MPNTTISIYLNDEDFVKYVQDKKEIHEKLRAMLRKVLDAKERKMKE